jgi:glycerol-3-phosphate acyltransferase PlsY
LPSLASYLIGSLSFAVIVSRRWAWPTRAAMAARTRARPTCCARATRARRSTLLLDALKGWVPVFCAFSSARAGAWVPARPRWRAGAFLGTCTRCSSGFQGGKGVATAAGVLLGVQPLLGLATLLTWLIIAVFFRYSSLSSLAAAFFAPAYYLIGGNIAWPLDRTVLIALIIMSLLLIWRHRENIRRLAAGTESKLGAKKKQA